MSAFAFLDWIGPGFSTYLGVAGALTLALSVALYAVPGGRLKVPGIVVSIVGSLGLGVALGMVLAASIPTTANAARGEAGTTPAPPPGAMGGMGGGPPGMGGPPGGGSGPPGGGGARGPNNKAQLANLVSKLDVLTEKPLTVQLSDEQRKEVKDQLKGLADAEDLSDDEAKAKSEKLHDLLKDQKATLEAAGYRWPGQGGGGAPGGGGPGGAGAPPPPPNPFKTEQNAKHLKALTERLDEGTKG